MPSPEINDLDPRPETEGDTIRVLSRSPKRGRAGAVSFLTKPEIEHLLNAATNPRDHAMISIGYHRGLRASEIGLLEMRDYTPPAPNERVGKLYCRRLKDSQSKVYDLTRAEQRDLNPWLRIRGKDPGPLFPSRNHRPISRKRLDRLIKQLGAQAKISKTLCHWHTLKHTCAVHLLQAGVGLDQVQSWLGHKDIHSTMMYLRVVDIRLADAAKRLIDTF